MKKEEAERGRRSRNFKKDKLIHVGK
jgi:hypothetical protein